MFAVISSIVTRSISAINPANARDNSWFSLHPLINGQLLDFQGKNPLWRRLSLTLKNRLKQILWFVGLWAFGVLSLGCIGLVIKFVL